MGIAIVSRVKYVDPLHPPPPFYEYRFVNTGKIVFVKVVLAWTEDRALRGRNLSADPRLEAWGRVSRDPLPCTKQRLK